MRGTPAGAGARGRPLVVVAGLPGAGKSTALDLLRSAPGAADLVVLDSASVRAWLLRRLPGVPYPVLRPVVHAMHWLRIAALALTRPTRSLVVHETATRPLSRRALLALARAAGRPAHLVWIEVADDVALRGQVDRHRVIRPRAYARHLRRVSDTHPAADAALTWDQLWRTDRDGATCAILAAAGIPGRPVAPPASSQQP